MEAGRGDVLEQKESGSRPVHDQRSNPYPGWRRPVQDFVVTVGMNDRIGSDPGIGVSESHRGFLTASAVVGHIG